MSKTFLEAYNDAKDKIDAIRKYSGNEEFIESMDTIMNFAMDYYIMKAEE